MYIAGTPSISIVIDQLQKRVLIIVLDKQGKQGENMKSMQIHSVIKIYIQVLRENVNNVLVRMRSLVI